MIRKLLVLLIALVVFGCSKKIATSTYEEPFMEFYDQFHMDEDFQLNRVRFPLEGEYVDVNGATKWTKEDWEPHLQKSTDISEAGYVTDFKLMKDEVIDKVWLEDSGFSIERRFERIDGKWYLVYYQTVNL